MSEKKSILLVDDDKDLVQSVKAFLEARQYDVRTAHNGTEARAQLEKALPNLIVLDIMMDYDAEGFNLAYKIRNEPATRHIPIIILTGFLNHLDSKYQSFEHIQGQDWPASKMFEKPVNLKELADSIEKLLAEADSLQAMLREAHKPSEL